MIRISKELREEFEKLRLVMTEMQYPGLVQDSVIGAIHSSKDQFQTLSKIKALLAKKPSAREMVTALQPIYREDCGIQSHKSQS